ncbi:MAG: glycosyltransferase [Oligoflexales bacterium]|nr:glycosyltransferase [Oligoflexales bacterium]
MQEKSTIKKIALVYGNLPTVEEIDQFKLLSPEDYEVNVVSSQSICGYLTQTSTFQDLKCIALPDYDENPSYLPGLEKVLADFDIVIVKERIGLYAFQSVKSKLRNKFRLVVWVDNLTAFPGEDVTQMRTVREEIANNADGYIVQTETARQTLIGEGIELDRIHLMPPWVSTNGERSQALKAAAAEAIGLGSEDFIIGHIGQVEWEEGLFTLVQAIKHAVDSDVSMARRLKLVICGIGSLSTELRNRVIKLGIDDRVVYLAPNRTSFKTMLAVCDCIYYGPIESRDRFEGDPYRLVSAMANDIPVLASRNSVVEEIIGKHRIDFCPGSIESLEDAITKAATAKSLLQNICKKNRDSYEKIFNQSKVSIAMETILATILAADSQIDISSLEHQIFEVEAKVKTKQYLAAIEMIESIFQMKDLAEHHKSNLYRLIGDCFTKLGDLDAGKDAYLKALEFDKYSAKAYIGLGTIGLTKASHDIAIIHFQKAISLAPDDEMANLGLGLAFQGMNELIEASRWIERSLEINPINTAAIYSLVTTSSDSGEYAKAERALRKYLSIHRNDHNMKYTLGGILYKMAAYSEVQEIMADIMKTDPLDSRAQALFNQAARAIESAKIGAAKSSNG